MAVQAPQVLDMLADSSSYTTIELEQGGYVMNAMYDVLPSDDDWVCRLDQIFETRISTLNPTPTTPITDAFDKSLLNREINVLLATPVDQVLAHRTSHVYGEIPVDAPRLQNVVVDINVSRNRWHTTGMYAVPGEVVTITVPQALVGQGYRIRINAHTDNIRKRSQWERFPYVHRWYEITSTTLQIASAFGGAIFIDFKGGPLDTPPSLGIQPVTISGAIEHPYFVVGQHTDQDWINELRDKPAPYAVFVCQDLMLVQRSEESSTLTEPTRLMEWWQTVITLQDEMAAYQVPRTGSEIINVDIQNSAGAAHSGFPIQAYDKHWGNLADVERKTSRGSWGDFHELGHNHQRGWWYVFNIVKCGSWNCRNMALTFFDFVFNF